MFENKELAEKVTDKISSILAKEKQKSFRESFMMALSEEKVDIKGAEIAFKKMVRNDGKFKGLFGAYKKSEDEILELVDYTFNKYKRQITDIMIDYNVDEGDMTEIIVKGP